MGQRLKILWRVAQNNLLKKQGAILIITLLIISALTALSVSFSEESRIELNLAQYSQGTSQARQMARAGFYLILTEIDKTEEEKAKESKESEEEKNERDWTQYGSLPFPEQLPDGITVEGKYSDESGKINLSYFHNELAKLTGKAEDSISVKNLTEQLTRLVKNLGIEDDTQDYALVSCLRDWLDKDSETGFKGAEDDYYQSLAEPYSCANSELLTLDQLFLIRGFNKIKEEGESEQEKITNALTIYGNANGAINVNAAPKEVLRSLHENIDADAILTYRQEQGEIKDIYAIPGVGVTKGDIKVGLIYGSDAPCYFIEVKAKVQEAEAYLRVVVKQNKNQGNQEKFKVLYWRMM